MNKETVTEFVLYSDQPGFEPMVVLQPRVRKFFNLNDSKQRGEALKRVVNFIKIRGIPIPTAEPLLSIDAKISYWYAHDILEAPFPMGEKAIASDPSCAYNYALKVIESRFPQGELAISSNDTLSYKYSKNVLKGPFHIGNRTFMMMHHMSDMYRDFYSQNHPFTMAI